MVNAPLVTTEIPLNKSGRIFLSDKIVDHISDLQYIASKATLPRNKPSSLEKAEIQPPGQFREVSDFSARFSPMSH